MSVHTTPEAAKPSMTRAKGAWGKAGERSAGLVGPVPVYSEVNSGREATATSKAREAAKAIANTLPMPSLCTDESGLCISANHAWRALTGLDEDRTRGRGWLDAVHPRDRSEVVAAWARFNEDRDPLWIRCRVHSGRGTTRWVRLSASWLPAVSGGGALAQLEDVTDLQRTREALSLNVRTLELVDQTTPVGQWRVRRKDQQFWGSRSLHRLQGTAASDPDLGLERWLDVYAPEDRAALRAALGDALVNGHPIEVTVRLQPGDGSVRVVAILGRAEWDLDGEVCALFGVMRDLSGWDSPLTPR